MILVQTIFFAYMVPVYFTCEISSVTSIGSFWGHLGIIFGSFGSRFGSHLGVILGGFSQPDGDDDRGRGSPFLYIQTPDRPLQRLLLVIKIEVVIQQQ